MPNLALLTRDVEMFEDIQLEYVRAELRVSEVATPWQGAPNSENVMTSVALEWIGGAIRTREKRRMRRCTSSRLSQLAAGPWWYVWFCVLTARSRRDGYEPECEVVRRQHLWRTLGCRG